MCKAFVKLNRPWGDQTGGARKWAIRDGCQNSFQMGSPTWTPPARFSQTGQQQQSAKMKSKARAIGKSKQLALGRGEDTPDRESSPFDETAGPSTGNPWDPERDPHPWLHEPAYQAHLARREAERAQAPRDEPHTPPAPQHYAPSTLSGSSYSLSPTSPYSYSHHEYMSNGGWHPAYSPEPHPHAYAPGAGSPARFSSVGSRVPSRGRLQHSYSNDYGTPVPPNPYHNGYNNVSHSQPAVYYANHAGSNMYVPLSPTTPMHPGHNRHPMMMGPGITQGVNGGHQYWQPYNPSSGSIPGSFAPHAPAFSNGAGGEVGGSFGTSNGLTGGQPTVNNNVNDEEDSPLTEITTLDFKTEP